MNILRLQINKLDVCGKAIQGEMYIVILADSNITIYLMSVFADIKHTDSCHKQLLFILWLLLL